MTAYYDDEHGPAVTVTLLPPDPDVWVPKIAQAETTAHRARRAALWQRLGGYGVCVVAAAVAGLTEAGGVDGAAVGFGALFASILLRGSDLSNDRARRARHWAGEIRTGLLAVTDTEQETP